MSLVKDPSGSFYLESDQFNVDYEEILLSSWANQEKV